MLDYLPGCGMLTVIFLFLVLPAWVRMRREERHARKALEDAKQLGQHEPLSIRPLVDLSRCVGSAACIKACPEQDVLKIIGGTVKIVQGSHCVGHGACAASCPTQAIQLVFGSEKRGVDLPSVGPDFQTNVPGMYIAGELGGMGLVANAGRQGMQAMQAASEGLVPGAMPVDVVIVGAGPAGICAALEAIQRGLSYVLLEQEAFGGAITHYPRQKLVMTSPIEFPGYGKVNLGKVSKEDLVATLQAVVAKTGLKISERERVAGVERVDGGFAITTSARTLHASRVILSVGRRGTPRRLDVPGEHRDKVTYRLLDPELYQYQHILVAGGGDSAIEAAVSLANQPGNTVTLAYRGDVINRPRPANVALLAEAEREGKITVLLKTKVLYIQADRVTLDLDGSDFAIANDYVFVFAGGVLPTAFLQAAGIHMVRHHGERIERV